MRLHCINMPINNNGPAVQSVHVVDDCAPMASENFPAAHLFSQFKLMVTSGVETQGKALWGGEIILDACEVFRSCPFHLSI